MPMVWRFIDRFLNPRDGLGNVSGLPLSLNACGDP
jgi:hypothetical protein